MPHITSYTEERWDLQDRGTDADGNECCHVRHITPKHVAVYRLVRFADGWRKVGDILPQFKGFRRYPERRGLRLSNSRMDLTLLSFCEHGHGGAHA